MDWPPDTLHHVHVHQLKLHRIQHLIFTHGHWDHLYALDLATRFAPFGHLPKEDRGLDIWGPEPVIDQLRSFFSKNMPEEQKDSIRLHCVMPFEEYRVGDATLTPMPADHSPGSLIHLFTRNGKTLLYGHDSGFFPEETWNQLSKHRLDLALLDCTNGNLDMERFHLGVDGVIKTKRRLQDMGCLNPGCRLFATHFSHNGGLLHHELGARLREEGIEVAFDGMQVSV